MRRGDNLHVAAVHVHARDSGAVAGAMSWIMYRESSSQFDSYHFLLSVRAASVWPTATAASLTYLHF